MSEEMDRVKSEIEEVEAIYTSARAVGPEVQKCFETAHLKLAFLGLLRTSFFDEGYNTQGDFNKTCLRKGGQIHSFMVNKRRTRIDFLKVGGRSQRRHSIFEKSPISKKQETKANPMEEISSMRENLAMYQGHLLHKFIKNLPGKRYIFRSEPRINDSEDLVGLINQLRTGKAYSKKEINKALQTAFVDTSKYMERCLESATALIKYMRNNGHREEAIALSGSMRMTPPYTKGPNNIYLLSKGLEVLKRAKILNRTSFRDELEKLGLKILNDIGKK